MGSMKELYRAVSQGKRILACLEPDVTQNGGVHQQNIKEYLTDEVLDGHKLKEKFAEWNEEKPLEGPFMEPPSAEQVIDALFNKVDPVEWSRLSHIQDVTIRSIVQRGLKEKLLREDDLILQGEEASKKVSFKKPRRIFVSNHNKGAWDLGTEIECIDQITNPKMLSFQADHEGCNGMLLLLNTLTWDASNEAMHCGLVEDVKNALLSGMDIILAHEAPSICEQDKK